jgi:hypothetical protein
MPVDKITQSNLYFMFCHSVSSSFNHLVNRFPCPPEFCIREVGSLRRLAYLVLFVGHLVKLRIAGATVFSGWFNRNKRRRGVVSVVVFGW